MTAYRKPGKRKKLPRELRTWFTKNADDTEKGPFELASLLSSGKAGRLRPSTLVRAEDEAEWRPLSALMAEEAVLTEPTPSASSSNRDEPYPGNFSSGLCAGLFGGLIGFVLVSAFAKGTETKRGARWGLVLQLGLGLVFRLFLATLPASRY